MPMVPGYHPRTMEDRQLWRRLRQTSGAMLPFVDPEARIAFGGLFVLGGIGMVWWAPGQSGRLFAWFLFAVVLGIACVATGIEQLRRQARLGREMARAAAEWAALRAGIAATSARGGSAVRFLQGRGYREFEVRRWILHKLRTD